MKFVFICQAVDQDHPIQATTLKWIESFAKHPQVEEFIVITLRAGAFSLPENVTVYPIQGRHRLITLSRFYRIIWDAIFREQIDFFFIHQGGPYPLLLLPFKLLMGKQIYQWKAHTYIGFWMQCYARFCDTKIFTSTANAFPMNLPKIKVVGQGVDIEKFYMKPVQKTGELVTVGRISPIKHLDGMLRVLDFCKRHYQKSYHLDIYGLPAVEKDLTYREELEHLVKELNISDQVVFKGAVNQAELPAILNAYRVFLNFCGGALSRSVVEAMACGLPVISTNICVADILPEELKSSLFVPRDNEPQQAQALHALLSQSDAELAEIGTTLRAVVVENHSVERLGEKILAEIQKGA